MQERSEDVKEDLIRITKLDNGIRVVSERMPFVRSAAVGLWVAAGSRDETAENNGIAHFIEHMLFKGTLHRSAREIAACLESRGGALNASTGKETTSYTAHILAEDLAYAVDVLADLILFPKFDPQDIELEKQVVLAEMAESFDDPEELVFDYFYQNIFTDHPLGLFVYGRPETVKAFSRGDLADFKQRNYTPENIVAAAAGLVEHEQFVELVEKAFADFPAAEKSSRRNGLMKAPLPYVPHRLASIHQAHICYGARTFGIDDERKYALALLDALLGGGMSSRLFQNIREKYGFTYSVYTFADLMQDTGVFGAYLACDKAKVDRSIELLKEEIEKIKDGDLSEKELEEAKAQVRGHLIIGMESPGRRLKKIAETESYKLPHLTVDEIIDSIHAVTTCQVTEMVRDLFKEGNTNITVVLP
ncbi:MAG: insulinase family protein [candidate division KSB1 bacterium]|nr:insulinase family protein [candidate division KSB1 bacterium]MDZ7345171.1 insulinase family protein [candidate division KSB1 bacterium]